MTLALIFAAISSGATALCVWGGLSPWWILPVWLGFFAAATLAYVVLLFSSLYLFLPKGNPSPRTRRIGQWCIKSLMRFLLVVLGVRVNIAGADGLPDVPYLLVSNHRSAFDPISTLAAVRSPLTFVAKPSVLTIPILGPLLGRLCFLAIDRENARNAVTTIKRAAELIKDVGLCIGIYPEGTRSKDGNLLPFHAGSFKIAKLAECPVAVVSVRVKKWGKLPRRVELRVVDVMDADYVAAANTAAMAERCEQALREDLGL